VPNSQLVQNAVTNCTLSDSLLRVRACGGVVCSADMKVVRETVQRRANGATWRSAGRDPIVLLRELGDNSVNWDVSV
jgi:small-conductance mechanosensitive channel